MVTATAGYSEYPWWRGNARFVEQSGQLLGAHLAQIALIVLWAGGMTLFELSHYDAAQPIYEQGLILVPNLARLGFGIGAGGQLVDPYPLYVVGVLHLISSMVLAAGGLYHALLGPDVLPKGKTFASSFGYDWTDASRMTSILGIHLVMLGLGALLFVCKAMFWGGLYDANIDAVRVITTANISPSVFTDFVQTGVVGVDRLEDVVGGHIWIAAVLIIGGIWHTISQPTKWAKEWFIWSGEAYLSYSLIGLAIMGLYAAKFVAVNGSVAYPEVLYGPLAIETGSAGLNTLSTWSAICLDPFATSRNALASTHIFLGLLAFLGHLWHAGRVRAAAAGFDFRQDQFVQAMQGDPQLGNLATPVNNSLLIRAFIFNLPIYRPGLSAFRRGLEIGMAHGYFILGPFLKLGPMRNADNADQIALISAIGLVVVLKGALDLYGTASNFNDRSMDRPEVPEVLRSLVGWRQFSSAFLLGGVGGAFFAHELLSRSLPF